MASRCHLPVSPRGNGRGVHQAVAACHAVDGGPCGSSSSDQGPWAGVLKRRCKLLPGTPVADCWILVQW